MQIYRKKLYRHALLYHKKRAKIVYLERIHAEIEFIASVM